MRQVPSPFPVFQVKGVSIFLMVDYLSSARYSYYVNLQLRLYGKSCPQLKAMDLKDTALR